MSKPKIGGTFFAIMRAKRKRWCFPVIIAGLLLGSGESSAIAPFIYSLF